MLFRKRNSHISNEFNSMEEKYDASQKMFVKNTGKVLIGIYDSYNDKMILRLAIPKKVRLVIEEKTGKFLKANYLTPEPGVDGRFIQGPNLSPNELSELYREHKDSIPRLYTRVSGHTELIEGSGHLYMVEKMLDLAEIENYWGFSVTPGKTFKDTKWGWTSRSLNRKDNINDDEFVPQKIQQQIQNTIKSWLALKPPTRTCLIL